MTPASSRRPAIDIARGIAVMGMMVEHLIPTEGAPSQLGRLVNTASGWFTGRSAALFFVLAGMSWAIQMDQRPSAGDHQWYVLRRAVALIAVGCILHLTVWPTEVLIAIGCALPIATFVRRGKDRAVWIVLVVIVFSIPFVGNIARPWVAQDWNDAGEPLLNWSTCFRLVFFDGCYPLMPWLAFVFAGMVAIQVQSRRILWFTGAAAVVSFVLVGVHQLQPAIESPFAIEWVPTSIPFLLVCGGAAFAVMFGIEALPQKVATSSVSEWLGCFGRMSLTHYIGHILLVVLPMRQWYPAEEWPTRIGVIAMVGYLIIAIPFSVLWLRRFYRGPIEWTLSKFVGSERDGG